MRSFTKEAAQRWIYRSYLHWIRYVNGLMMPGSPSSNVIPAALHLPHMQNFDGIFDAKIDLINDVILFPRWPK